MINDYFPIGGVLIMGGSQVDAKIWLPCDGNAVKKDDYPLLYAVIGDLYTPEPSDTDFNLPDYRGYFLRGTSGTSQTDPDVSERINVGLNVLDTEDEIGTKQEYATKLPSPAFQGSAANLATGNIGVSGETSGGGAKDDGSYSGATCQGGGDKETRPRNVYINYYIKARSK